MAGSELGTGIRGRRWWWPGARIHGREERGDVAAAGEDAADTHIETVAPPLEKEAVAAVLAAVAGIVGDALLEDEEAVARGHELERLQEAGIEAERRGRRRNAHEGIKIGAEPVGDAEEEAGVAVAGAVPVAELLVKDAAAERLAGGGGADYGCSVGAHEDLEQHIVRER
uniref:Uncharacterized protein n=1 Tax=Oryza glumipatula TaxID=40148 RepID=A0A0D9ZDV2_9ORYZ